MARLARVSHTGSVVAIIKGEELVNTKEINGKQQYPVTFFGEPEFVNFIIQNGNHYENNIGLKFNDLSDWAI
jgi:hypothetical protein